jgi:hypothetical protein
MKLSFHIRISQNEKALAPSGYLRILVTKPKFIQNAEKFSIQIECRKKGDLCLMSLTCQQTEYQYRMISEYYLWR